ncbi:MAG: helix-turn-helix domain-containing protein [Pyrinomonadaceae bacterium]
MGKRARPKPKHLAEKLLQIRETFGLSQSEMFKRLDVGDFSEVKRISDYEIDKSEPPLIVLLRYAQVSGVCLDDLVDDKVKLPVKLPSKPKHTRR